MNINYEALQFFVLKKVIKRKDMKSVLEECTRLNMSAEQYLTAKGIALPAQAMAAMGELYNLPNIEMDMLEVDRSLVDRFGLAFLRRHKIVPVSIDKDGVLLMAVGRPMDPVAFSNIAVIYDGKIDYVYVPQIQIDIFVDAIVAVQTTSEALDVINKDQDDELLNRIRNAQDTGEGEAGVINTPAVRLVDSFIKEAIPYRASDIHIEPSETTVRVRYRIDGDLLTRAEFPIDSYPAIVSRLKILAGINVSETRTPQDGRISLTVNGTPYDFRVSTLPIIYGEKFVIRILDKSSFRLTREDLGFSDENNELLDRILAAPHGIILLCGPTGSGKSTTLYTFLKELNTTKVNIVTVEDPVEYTLNGINQVQVNAKADLTFANAIRAILRQDPDVVMIGEIRDEETAQIAIRAAITGHLVLSTIHTNDAPSSVSRLVEMGASNYLVGDALVAVIAQRLVKRLCPVCKKRGKTNPKEMALLNLKEPVSICRPFGCQFCNGTGYKGRMAVHEIMYVNEGLKEMISDPEFTVEELRSYSKEHGMIPLWDACRDFVLKGVTSLPELMKLTVESAN